MSTEHRSSCGPSDGRQLVTPATAAAEAGWGEAVKNGVVVSSARAVRFHRVASLHSESMSSSEPWLDTLSSSSKKVSRRVYGCCLLLVEQSRFLDQHSPSQELLPTRVAALRRTGRSIHCRRPVEVDPSHLGPRYVGGMLRPEAEDQESSISLT